MTASRRKWTSIAVLTGIAALGVLLLACSEEPSPTAVDRGRLTGAKGPGPKVNATDPTGAERDTTLTVRVLGSNFDDGSTARFLLNGVDTGKIVTNSTTFIDESELEADITIAADADTALYDVEVQAARGKKGIGLELFAVRDKNANDGPNATILVEMSLRDAVGDRITSDGLGSYLPGVDNVESVVADPFNSPEEQKGYFFRMEEPKGKDKPERDYCFNFPATNLEGDPTPPGLLDGSVCTHGNFATLQHSNGPDGLPVMEVGDRITARARFFLFPGDGLQYVVRFACGASGSDDPSCASWVVVERTETGWTIEAAGQVAQLRSITIRGKTVVTELGTYQMPFRMDLTELPSP